MPVNPAGFVPVFDTGEPDIITAIARETISGGQFVNISGASDAVSSGINSFASANIQVATGASGNGYIGVAIQNVTSGLPIGIAVGNVSIISRCIDAVTAGTTVIVNGDDAILSATTAGFVIGRALTTGTSGNYALWKPLG